MWLGVEAETEGVVKRGVSKNPENPDVLSQQLAATHSHVCVFIYANCCFGERHLTIITQSCSFFLVKLTLMKSL